MQFYTNDSWVLGGDNSNGTSAAISRCGVKAIGMELDFRCISNRRGRGNSA